MDISKIGNFSLDVQKTFEDLDGYFYLPTDRITVTDRTVTFDLPGMGFRRSLILVTEKSYCFDRYECVSTEDAQLKKADGGYILSFDGVLSDDAANPENEGDMEPIEIFFTDVTTQIELYRADLWLYNSPWDSLTVFATEIINRATLGEQYLNEKEKALLPFLRELSAMWYYTAETDRHIDFSNLIPLFEKHGLKSVIKALEKVRKKDSDLNRRMIQQRLNRAECEPLWREIYAKIVDSQKDYPDSSESYNRNDVAKIRARIEQKMHALGYEGTYPDFHKSGAMKGLHLVSSYDMLYWAGCNKNAEYFVKCLEDVDGYACSITFLCGTALPKKGETVEDAFSCTFNYNGNRFFKTVEWGDDALGSLEHFVAIAAKKAEDLKLNEIEKALMKKQSFGSSFLATLVLTGGFFAVFFTLIFFLFVCVLEISIEHSTTFPDLFRSFPWLFCFLFCFFGFGGTMAVLEWLEKRK